MMISNADTWGPNAKPTVGTPCTICYYSDSRPAKIIEVKTGRRPEVVVQEMGHKCIRGSAQDGSAEYEYFDDPNGAISTFSLRKNGSWIAKGSSGGCCLSIGHARFYYDPSF